MFDYNNINFSKFTKIYVMNLKIKMSNVLFLDIETVPQKESWTEVSEITQELFSKKTAYQRKEDITAKDFYEKIILV